MHLLQDYLAGQVLRICGDVKLPLQVHTGLGADAGLVLADSNPALLDRLLSRTDTQHARVVCLHGGYPFCKQAGVVAKRNQVWLDFSWMVLLFRPVTLASYLKEWIEIVGPEALIYGVDGAGLAVFVGNWCVRQGITLALTQLVLEQHFTEAEALAAARAILHDNAVRFYGDR